MNERRIAIAFIIAAVWGLLCAPAIAVIRVEMPVSKIYGASKAVFVGKVTGVAADNRLVDVSVTSVLRGDSPGRKLRVQIVSPAEVIRDVASGQPMLMFVGKARGGSMAVLHLADTWLLANRVANSSPQVWRVVQKHDAKQTFPGRTVALLRLVRQIAVGKGTIMDKTGAAFFRSSVRKLAKLNVQKARWILAADVDKGKDGKPDLLIGTAAAGVRLMLATGDGYKDMTAQWGLGAADGSGYRAFSRRNRYRRTDLILGDTLWINHGMKFVAAKERLPAPKKGAALATALADINGDGQVDAMFLTVGGEVHIVESRSSSGGGSWRLRSTKTLWKAEEAPAAAEFGDWGDTGAPHVIAVRESGIARYSLDAAGGPPADFERLTGVNLKRYYERYREGFKNVLAVALDVDGNNRRDLFVVCDTGGMLLVNRGFGTFLCDYDAGGEIAPHAKTPAKFKVTPQTPWTAVDMNGDGWDDLLVLTADGALYEVPNRPPKESGRKRQRR